MRKTGQTVLLKGNFISVCGHLTLTLYLLVMYFVRCLLLTFVNSLDLDQVQQNIGPGLDLN